MHVHWQVLRKNVRQVGLAADPFDVKLSLADAAFDPIESKRLSKIIAIYSSRGLWVAKRFQHRTFVGTNFTVSKYTSIFSLRNSSTHNGDARTVTENRPVEKARVSSAKEVKPSGSTAGVGAVQKGSIGMYT